MNLTLRLKTNNNGFTLLEVLVAVTISAVVITLVYTSLFQIIQTKDRVEERSEQIHEIRVLFSRIEKDLANAYRRGGINPASQSTQNYFLGTLEGEDSRLVFTTFTRDTEFEPGQTDQTEVTYYLKENEEKDGTFSLLRRDNPFPGNENGGFVFPIAENVVKFELNYTDESSFDVLTEGELTRIREWSSAAIGSLPKAVELFITLKDENNEDKQFSSIFLVPAGNN
ncbi:MAG: prepilin-type N-terminal cleavage/methylation domain-containing protein [Thermodesulfobacteriota bacterium]